MRGIDVPVRFNTHVLVDPYGGVSTIVVFGKVLLLSYSEFVWPF